MLENEVKNIGTDLNAMALGLVAYPRGQIASRRRQVGFPAGVRHMAKTIEQLLDNQCHPLDLMFDILQVSSVAICQVAPPKDIGATLDDIQRRTQLMGNATGNPPDHGDLFLILQLL